MNILGVYPVSHEFGHDTGAAIVSNGKIIAAAEEERFTRRKHDTSAPRNSIAFCLNYAKLGMDDIDYIAVPWSPKLWLKYKMMHKQTDFFHNILDFLVFPVRSHPARFRKKASLLSSYFDYDYFNQTLEKFSPLPPISYYEHHRAHAATAFYASNFDSASIVTVDGQGELNSTVSWKGNGSKISKLREEPVSNSLGYFYHYATQYLNLGFNGEGKTMGLAPYGSPDAEMEKKLRQHMDAKGGKWYNITKMMPDQSVLGFPKRSNEDIMGANYRNYAFHVQKMLEEAMLRVVEDAVSSSGERKLCLSGGVALNCTTNSKILESGMVDDLFVFPAASDGGSPVGAALECASENGEKVNFRLEHPYFGPEFSDAEIENALKRFGLKYEECKDISGTVGELIHKANVIGWFQGRMELGPRALGNRSIIADPTNSKMLEKVNNVKQRESWRPLAPSMLFEAKDEYLENARDSPFMILSFTVKKEKRKEVPAIVHVDGSTRPHTVKRAVNRKYYDAIKAFENSGGVPIVMNTSFNVGNEPVVCTPEDAIRTFYSSMLDYLAIGSFLVKK